MSCCFWWPFVTKSKFHLLFHHPNHKFMDTVNGKRIGKEIVRCVHNSRIISGTLCGIWVKQQESGHDDNYLVQRSVFINMPNHWPWILLRFLLMFSHIIFLIVSEGYRRIRLRKKKIPLKRPFLDRKCMCAHQSTYGMLVLKCTLLAHCYLEAVKIECTFDEQKSSKVQVHLAFKGKNRWYS